MTVWENETRQFLLVAFVCVVYLSMESLCYLGLFPCSAQRVLITNRSHLSSSQAQKNMIQ